MPYQHDNKNPNLNNLHHAMELVDEIPHVRVTLGSDNITITGDVNLVDTVTVNSTPEDPVHTHITEVGTSGILTGPYMPIQGTVTVNQPVAVTDNNGSLTVDGTVSLSANTLSALETITVNQGTAGATAWKVDIGNNGTVTANVTFPETQQVSGTVALDTNTLTALENINATVSGTVELGSTTLTALENVGVTGTVTVQDGGGSITVDGTVTANITGTANVAFGGTSADAFGRLRVSNPFTLFDGALRYRDDEFRWNQVDTGNGLSVFQPNESTMLMTVAGNGDSAVRQSKQVFSYQPGKSLLTMMTFVMNTPTAGLRQRVGYFGAQNGVYFEVDGTTVNLVIRKYTSGSVDDTTEKVSQSAWNGDRLLGAGASGITLDVTHSQIFWCDVEWLGVGSVRAGFVINGQFIVCHTFHHANIFDRVYMTTASLPVRYELSSTGAAGTMRAICSTVISEGGYSNRSQSRAIGTSLTGKNLSQAAYRPLVCIRLKSANIDSIVVPTKFDLYGLQQAAFSYRIILNPTLTDASWTSAGSNSSVEYDLSATALTGGTVIDEGIFVGSNKGGTASVSGNDVDFSQQLGRTIAGVSDIWCLAAIATTNNDDAVASVTWQEHG